MKEVRLNLAALAIRTHPRTILRALAGRVNTYWAEGYKDPDSKREERELSIYR